MNFLEMFLPDSKEFKDIACANFVVHVGFKNEPREESPVAGEGHCRGRGEAASFLWKGQTAPPNLFALLEVERKRQATQRNEAPQHDFLADAEVTSKSQSCVIG